tara:strand:+ start:3773 stop:4282 length:510 start_codon:yes stop_codon:yes gene_type:complete
MHIDFLKEVDRKGLIHPFNPYWSRPEHFIELIDKYEKTTYRSTFWIDFEKFKPYKYFIVFFVEAGTNGEIPAWGLCERGNCERVKNKQDYNSYLEAKFGFPGDKDPKFKSLFWYKHIQLFERSHNCSELSLVKNKQPITNLRLLRSALYVEIPFNILEEIKYQIKNYKR